MIVLDDRHLLDVLAGQPHPEVSLLADDGVATTTSWYFRLSKAVVGTGRPGSLKTRFANLPPDKQDTVRNRLESLPSDIELVDSHDLVPIMAACSANTPSNFLTLEGVAAALILDATVIVSTQSAQIDHVGGSHAVPVLLVPL